MKSGLAKSSQSNCLLQASLIRPDLVGTMFDAAVMWKSHFRWCTGRRRVSSPQLFLGSALGSNAAKAPDLKGMWFALKELAICPSRKTS